MTLTLRNEPARRAAMLAEVAFFLLAAAWIIKTAAANALARRNTVAALETAVRLAPDDAEYRLRLGRLYLYDTTRADPARALNLLQTAARLNAYSPRVWLDLAAAFESEGRLKEAAACLNRADRLAPRLPVYQWTIGNFYLLHGSVPDTFRHFQQVLAGTSRYDGTIFDIAWKATGDAPQILDQLIPHHTQTEFAYLNYLVGRKQMSAAEGVWMRLRQSPEPFPATTAEPYFSSLIDARQPAAAYQVWQDLLGRGALSYRYATAQGDLITNGDFEEDLLNLGFDWKLAAEDTYVELDTSTFYSPSRALFIQFPGGGNLDYRPCYQQVKVEPGRAYRLQAQFKTEGITTDSGPRLEVRDAYDTTTLNKLSEDVQGTHLIWTARTVDFVTGPTTELITVAIRRLPSREPDSQFAGKVWVDSVSLAEVVRRAKVSR